jgi:catechol 2,3-dioxygenase
MAYTPVAVDHVNLYVRNAQRSHEWYTDVLGLHTQDIFYHQGSARVRAAFLACNPDHAHDIALFDVGDDAAGPARGQVGLNHVAWRMSSLGALEEMYHRLTGKGIPFRVADHSVSIGIYFSDPDGHGLEVYYELPRSEWGQERPFSEQDRKGRFPGPWDDALRQQAAATRA